jgi:hypothetical protein
MAYYFPFWHLTSDDGRNAAVADRIEEAALENDRLLDEEMAEWGDPLLGTFRDIRRLRRLSDGLFLELARTKMGVLSHKGLPAIDHARCRDAIRRLLGSARRRLVDVRHPWTVPAFGDGLFKSSMWENSAAFEKDSPGEWNAVAVARVSDFHRCVSDFCRLSELRALRGEDPPGSLDDFKRVAARVGELVGDYCRFLKSL